MSHQSPAFLPPFFFVLIRIWNKNNISDGVKNSLFRIWFLIQNLAMMFGKSGVILLEHSGEYRAYQYLGRWEELRWQVPM